MTGNDGQQQAARPAYLAEVIEDSHALHLLHLAVQAAQWDTRPEALECFMEEADLLASGHEDNHLALQHANRAQTLRKSAQAILNVGLEMAALDDCNATLTG